jgi:hypothetical protein
VSGVTYVLPIRRSAVTPNDDLPGYLLALSAFAGEVIVADGSPPEIFAVHAAAFPATIRHVRVGPGSRGANGKVAGVHAGMARASFEHVIIADDDVRYGPGDLAAVSAALERSDIVRPQNYFAPLTWHAVLDEGRSLIARMTGGDWSGTLGVRRSTFERAGGYRSDVLFENLELVRTIRALGGRERVLYDVFVARRPPAAGKYFEQRVRQAYDEFARPLRLVLQLALAPAAFWALRARGPRSVVIGSAFAIALAEAGRRRAGGRRYFPPYASLLAPVWVIERALTSWLAVAAYLAGGVPYAGGRLRAAATPTRLLRLRLREAS